MRCLRNAVDGTHKLCPGFDVNFLHILPNWGRTDQPKSRVRLCRCRPEMTTGVGYLAPSSSIGLLWLRVFARRRLGEERFRHRLKLKHSLLAEHANESRECGKS